MTGFCLRHQKWTSNGKRKDTQTQAPIQYQVTIVCHGALGCSVRIFFSVGKAYWSGSHDLLLVCVCILRRWPCWTYHCSRYRHTPSRIPVMLVDRCSRRNNWSGAAVAYRVGYLSWSRRFPTAGAFGLFYHRIWSRRGYVGSYHIPTFDIGIARNGNRFALAYVSVPLLFGPPKPLFLQRIRRRHPGST